MQFSSEESIVQFWESSNIFAKSLRPGAPQFIMYEGPPFATGSPHYGHVLAGYIKDTIGRWATINGKSVPRISGFDCHGLPIEYEIEKLLGIKTKQQILDFSIEKYNGECRKIVLRCEDEWKSFMKRAGRWIDFDSGYKTMDKSYMSMVWSVFSKIYAKGLIYEGVKIMPYSIACTTPLSNFEATSNYQKHTSRTMVLKFPLVTHPNTYFLSWTTTPWTLPAHYALCVNKQMEYVKVFAPEKPNEFFILGKSRIQWLEEKTKTKFTIESEYLGIDLVNIQYTPPYNFVGLGIYKVTSADFVSDDAGTGIVHLAPAFGEDDYKTCMGHGLITKELSSLYIHINESGISQKCGHLSDLTLSELSKAVIKELVQNSVAMVVFQYEHSYPFCWRSDTPLIYKAVNCWFLNVESIKSRLVEINKTIKWVPESVGSARFHNWLDSTRDWCISRNRYWGTPIPIFKSDCGQILLVESVEHLEKLSGQKIDDAHSDQIDKLVIVSDGIVYKRVDTVLDCWFESGCVPYMYPNSEARPADFIAEGLDQTRGWFYTLLVISTILHDRAPFSNVIVNGLVLAEDNTKMSKRLKNYPDPTRIIEEYGADALRYYLLTSGASNSLELRFSPSGVKEIAQITVIPLKNSLGFLREYRKLACANSPNGTIRLTDQIEESSEPFDSWILVKTQEFLEKLAGCFNSYQLFTIGNHVIQYIENLNNNYIRLHRDTIKGKNPEDPTGSKCTQSINVLRYVLNKVSIGLSPILPFLAEMIYQETKLDAQPESVHLELFNPKITNVQADDPQVRNLDKLFTVIDTIRKIRSLNDIPVKRPLSHVSIYTDEQIEQFENLIGSETNIINIQFGKLADCLDTSTVVLSASINQKMAGQMFRQNKKGFEQVVGQLTQTELENWTNGTFQLNWMDLTFSSESHPGLVTINRTIKTNCPDYIRTLDGLDKIKVLVDTRSDPTVQELYVAKLIATGFQRARKVHKFHVYDNLKLIMEPNKFNPIVEKHMDYIVGITRVPITYGTIPNGAHYSIDIDSTTVNMYLQMHE